MRWVASDVAWMSGDGGMWRIGDITDRGDGERERGIVIDFCVRTDGGEGITLVFD